MIMMVATTMTMMTTTTMMIYRNLHFQETAAYQNMEHGAAFIAKCTHDGMNIVRLKSVDLLVDWLVDRTVTALLVCLL